MIAEQRRHSERIALLAVLRRVNLARRTAGRIENRSPYVPRRCARCGGMPLARTSHEDTGIRLKVEKSS